MNSSTTIEMLQNGSHDEKQLAVARVMVSSESLGIEIFWTEAFRNVLQRCDVKRAYGLAAALCWSKSQGERV
jgi:hypothetical protein